MPPVAEAIKDRYRRMGVSDNIYATGTVVTADTGFANEANMQYLHDENINGYIPDNQFRSRDPKFKTQKDKHKRRSRAKSGVVKLIPASDFHFDPGWSGLRVPSRTQYQFSRHTRG